MGNYFVMFFFCAHFLPDRSIPYIRYLEDDTSPLLTDPLNPDEYSYSILSKLLFKPPADHAPTTDHDLCTECSGHHH